MLVFFEKIPHRRIGRTAGRNQKTFPPICTGIPFITKDYYAVLPKTG